MASAAAEPAGRRAGDSCRFAGEWSASDGHAIARGGTVLLKTRPPENVRSPHSGRPTERGGALARGTTRAGPKADLVPAALLQAVTDAACAKRDDAEQLGMHASRELGQLAEVAIWLLRRPEP